MRITLLAPVCMLSDIKRLLSGNLKNIIYICPAVRAASQIRWVTNSQKPRRLTASGFSYDCSEP